MIMSRAKHLHIMYIVIFVVMLIPIYFAVPINDSGLWVFWLCGSIVMCVGLVAMIRRFDILLSLCVLLLCADVIAAHIVYMLFGVCSVYKMVCRIISAVVMATFYFLGFMRKFDTTVDGKQCLLYAIAAVVVLIFGKMANLYYGHRYDEEVATVGNFNVYMLLAEFAATSFILSCDKPFAKFYAVGAIGFTCIMAIVNLSVHAHYHINMIDNNIRVVCAVIAKALVVVGITAAYCCYTLIGKQSDEYYLAPKICSVGTRPTNEQTDKPLRSENKHKPSKSRPIEKSEIDLKLERLESLRADGTLDEEEYKDEVIKLLGGKNNV